MHVLLWLLAFYDYVPASCTGNMGLPFSAHSLLCCPYNLKTAMSYEELRKERRRLHAMINGMEPDDERFDGALKAHQNITRQLKEFDRLVAQWTPPGGNYKSEL